MGQSNRMTCGLRALEVMGLPLPVNVRPRGSLNVAKWTWPLTEEAGCEEVDAYLTRARRCRLSGFADPACACAFDVDALWVEGDCGEVTFHGVGSRDAGGIRGGVVDRWPRSFKPVWRTSRLGCSWGLGRAYGPGGRCGLGRLWRLGDGRLFRRGELRRPDGGFGGLRRAFCGCRGGGSAFALCRLGVPETGAWRGQGRRTLPLPRLVMRAPLTPVL